MCSKQNSRFKPKCAQQDYRNKWIENINNSNQKWNNDKCRCDCKKHHTCEKDYISDPATYTSEKCKCKYLASIIDNPVITCN